MRFLMRQKLFGWVMTGFLSDDAREFLGYSKNEAGIIERNSADIFHDLHKACVGQNTNDVVVASMNLLFSSARQIENAQTKLELASMLKEMSDNLRQNAEEANKEISSKG